MTQDDKRLSDMEAALSKLTRRVDTGFADLGRLVAERHETDEIARLQAEIHRRDEEIANLRAGASGQAVAGSGRSNSIPKIYARTRRRVLTRLNANESARRVMSRLPHGMQDMLRNAASISNSAATPASALPPFDPHGSRPSNLAGNGLISIERLCLLAQEVSDAKETRA